jgi:hypothetical protein
MDPLIVMATTITILSADAVLQSFDLKIKTPGKKT